MNLCSIFGIVDDIRVPAQYLRNYDKAVIFPTKTCEDYGGTKVRFPTKEDAEDYIAYSKLLAKQRPGWIPQDSVYFCKTCNCWHTTTGIAKDNHSKSYWREKTRRKHLQSEMDEYRQWCESQKS